MKCPNCGSKTYVIETRQIEKNNKYRHCLMRRRMCYKCKNRFTTYEVQYELLKESEKAIEMMKNIAQFADCMKGEKK